MYRTIIILSIILFTAPIFADETTDRAEFKKLYAEFNDLYSNSEDLAPVMAAADKLYELAPKAYGKNHNNTAVVTYNLAKIYDEMGNTWSEYTTGKRYYKSKASAFYKMYFNILNKLKAPKDETYVSQYFSFVLADIQGLNYKSSKKYIDRLIRFAKKLDIPENEIADLEYNIAITIIGVADPRDAQKYLTSSYNRNKKIFGDNHFKIGENLFWRAKLDFIKKHYTRAEKRYKKALLIFENNVSLSTQLLPQTHAFLIALYEETNRPELSTEHSQALAVERPDDFDRYLEPLYKIMPDFPKRLGHVIPRGSIALEFKVDKEGKTKDIIVAESDYTEYRKPTIEAISKWRYAPTIRNGELVETTGVKYSIKFTQ